MLFDKGCGVGGCMVMWCMDMFVGEIVFDYGV